MGLSISNDTLIKLQYGLNKSNFNIQNSLLRLATGFRINSAKDDAASLSLASKLKSQMQGNLVAKQNTQKAQDYISMADSALGKMEEAAQNIRTKLLEAANGTYSSEERAIIQNQINSLASNIYNLKNTTTYNDIKVFGESGEPTIKEVEQMSAEQAESLGYTVITTADELKSISGSGKYMLMNDIDLQGTNLGVKNLSGTFDGNGYTISNLTITTEDTGVKGLFTTSTGTIKNLTLLDVNIDTNENYVGGLVGTGKTIINCVVTGTIHSTQGTIGGMIGKLEGSAKNVMADVDVTSSGGSHIGGLVGNMSWGPSIINGAAKGNVKGYNSVGGLVGSIQCGTINNSYATGNVTATNAYAAGIIGYINGSGGDTIINNSYATGDIKAGSYAYGFAGAINTTSSDGTYGGIYTNCYSTGNVTATRAYGDAVGFASMTGNNSHFTNCFSTGKVKEGTNGHAYAFSGNAPNKTINCYVSDSTGGTNSNPNVMEQSASWFNVGSNLSFLGDSFNFDTDHPQILTNMEFVPKSSEVTIQVGANEGDDNRMSIDLAFNLPSIIFDVSTSDKANESLVSVDNLLSAISLERTKAGYKANMLDDIMASQTVRAQNYESSISSIMDTDYAKETANLVRQQILQEVTSSLIAQANISQFWALDLLNNTFIGYNNNNNNNYNWKINFGIMRKN